MSTAKGRPIASDAVVAATISPMSWRITKRCGFVKILVVKKTLIMCAQIDKRARFAGWLAFAGAWRDKGNRCLPRFLPRLPAHR
jgi:hypothetical protein